MLQHRHREDSVDGVTSSWQGLLLLTDIPGRYLKRLSGPDGENSNSIAPGVVAQPGSPAPSLVSSSGSVSFRGSAQNKEYDSPTSCTASSSGSVSFKGRYGQHRPRRSLSSDFLPAKACFSSTEEPNQTACLSSTKGPATPRGQTECLSSTKGPSGRLSQAQAESPVSPRSMTDADSPGLSIISCTCTVIPFSRWFVGVAGGAVGSPAVAFHLNPGIDNPAVDAFCSGLADGAAAVTPASAQEHAHHGPRAVSVGMLRTAHSQPPSAGLSPVIEAMQKVAFDEWFQKVGLSTPRRTTPGVTDPSAEISALPSSAGCLSTVSQTPERLAFAAWLEACTAASPVSPLRSIPLRMWSPVSGTTTPTATGGGARGLTVPARSTAAAGGDGSYGAAPLASQAAIASPKWAVAAAVNTGGLQLARASIVAAPHVRLSQAAIAPANGGLPGSPIPCRKAPTAAVGHDK